jgi:hypothetical protein
MILLFVGENTIAGLIIFQIFVFVLFFVPLQNARDETIYNAVVMFPV